MISFTSNPLLQKVVVQMFSKIFLEIRFRTIVYKLHLRFKLMSSSKGGQYFLAKKLNTIHHLIAREVQQVLKGNHQQCRLIHL